jgi:hypothetical protein
MSRGIGRNEAADLVDVSCVHHRLVAEAMHQVSHSTGHVLVAASDCKVHRNDGERGCRASCEKTSETIELQVSADDEEDQGSC